MRLSSYMCCSEAMLCKCNANINFVNSLFPISRPHTPFPPTLVIIIAIKIFEIQTFVEDLDTLIARAVSYSNIALNYCTHIL